VSPVLNLFIILLSILLQIAAAGLALRMNRIVARPVAWMLISGALVLMAGRRLHSVGALVEAGLPSGLLLNEVLGLVISTMLLVGVIHLREIFLGQAAQATRLAEARTEAHSEADKLRAVMAAVPVPLWIAEDQDCRIVRGNPVGGALLRLPVGENHAAALAGEGPSNLFHLAQGGEVLVAARTPLHRAAKGGEVIHDEPLDLVFTDGEIRHLRAYATPLRDHADHIHGALCSLVDVTQTRKVEEALSRAQKMESLGMLSGGIAHDFNNIFQAMVANLEMAQVAIPENSKAHPYLLRLNLGLARASQLSRDLLHCSGGDLRRPEFQALSPLVAQILDRMGTPLARELAESLPLVLVDPVLMGRVVENLVTNALEASHGGGAIRVRTGQRSVTAKDLGTGLWPEAIEPGSYVVLEVTDQGHGIEAATLSKIFDPFFSTREVGRGLGLAAALGIVRGHRGGIQVESIPGVGSVFRVHLPSPEGTEVPVPVPDFEVYSGNLVLLVDDELDLREVMAEMLQDWFGLKVISASDGVEALAQFNQNPERFDLVILDATMPRMGGVEAFQAMRAIRPTLPGILCSGYALQASRDQAIAQGFTDFLKKPFTSAELEDLINRALGPGPRGQG